MGIRAKEWPLLALMMAHFFVSQATMTLLQSVNLGLFLASFDLSWLPWYFLAKGCLLLVLSVLYAFWSGSHFSRQTELLGFIGVTLAMLVLARILMVLEWSGSHFALPVFWEAFISLFTLQSWALYSDCIDSRQSRRLLPLIGAGGTCGAMMGGLGAAYLVHSWGAENILFLAMALLLLLLYLSSHLLRHYLKDSLLPLSQPETPQFWPQLQQITLMIVRSRLLWLFALVIIGVKTSTSLIDFQQQTLLKQTYHQNDITAFMGQFFMWTNLLTLLIQGTLENRLILAYGALFGLACAPMMQAGGALLFLFQPTLMMLSAMRLLEQVTHKSFYKTAINLIYLVFNSKTRRKIRLLLNGVLEFSATLFIALMALLFSDLPLQLLSGLVLLVAGISVLLCYWMRQPYYQKLQDALMNRRLRLDDDMLEHQSAETYAALIRENLTQSNPELVLFSLELLQHTAPPFALTELEVLYQHPQSEIRAATLAVMKHFGTPAQVSPLLKFLAQEKEPRIRCQILQVLRTLGDEELNPQVIPYLADPDPQVQAESIVFLFVRGGMEGILTGAEHLKRMLGSTEIQDLKQVAYIMGEIGVRYFRQDLSRLLAHPSAAVQDAALKALAQSADPYFMTVLLQRLTANKFTRQVRQCLEQYPAEVIWPRLQAFFQESTALGPRIECFKIIQNLDRPEIFHHVLQWLLTIDGALRAPLIRTLYYMRKHYHHSVEAELALVHQTLTGTLQQGYHYHWLIAAIYQNPLEPERLALLIGELKYHLRQCQEQLFRLLALLYEPKRMEQAYLNFCSLDPYYRALSLDLLHVVLAPEWAELLLPLLDEMPTERRLALAQEKGLLKLPAHLNWWEHEILTGDFWLNHLVDWYRRLPDLTEENLFAMIDKIYLLKKTHLFARFSVAQLEPVAKVAQELSLAAGTKVFTQQAPGDAMYIVCSGQVAVTWDNKELARLGEKECFGEVEVLNASPRLAGVHTLTECELLVIRREDFIDLVEDYPDFSKGLLEMLSQRLSDAFARARAHKEEEYF